MLSGLTETGRTRGGGTAGGRIRIPTLGVERASLLGLPAAEQGRVLGVCEVLLGLLGHVHGLEVVGLPGLLVFLHELGGLNRVGPHANRLRSGNQHGHARRAVVRGVLGRAPEDTARLGAVT